MEHKKEHFRHILYFFYREGINAAESHRRILSVYGEVSLSEHSCRNWFQKFSSGDFSVHNSHRSGRPMADIDDDIQALIESDRHITERELGEKLNVPNSTIHDHIQKLGLVKKLDIWVPHELKEIHLTQRISTCDLLFKRNQDESFLKRIVTGDEKWVVYNNTERKRSWSKHGEPSQPTSKPELHQKKVMLSIWWDYKGVVYYELLPRGRTINSEVYCQQLTKLNESLQRSRPELVNRKGVIFHHDNARPHTSLMTRQKLLDLGWELMPHPPYSPDLAPSDYHLFHSMQNSLNGKTFTNDDDVKSHLDQFIGSRDQDFYQRGIFKLPERWQKVIAQHGNYITE